MTQTELNQNDPKGAVGRGPTHPVPASISYKKKRADRSNSQGHADRHSCPGDLKQRASETTELAEGKMMVTRLQMLLGVLVMLAMSAIPRVEAQVAQPDYTLNAGDTLDIDVYKEVELTKTVTVRPDGKLSFPLAGEITAGGRTIPQVQAEITQRLLKYMPEPVVTVAVKTLDGCRIYVIGQVAKAGSFVMNPRISVLQALSLAGGMTPFASTNDVVVIRGAGATQKVIPFRYGEVSKGKNVNQNVMLEPGDVVVVP